MLHLLLKKTLLLEDSHGQARSKAVLVVAAVCLNLSDRRHAVVVGMLLEIHIRYVWWGPVVIVNSIHLLLKSLQLFEVEIVHCFV